MSLRIVNEGMSFGRAFDTIKNYPTQRGMRLPKWNEDVVIKVQMPDKDSKMTAPYLYIESRFGRVPWKETMVEMFSNDWQLVDIEESTKSDDLDDRRMTTNKIDIEKAKKYINKKPDIEKVDKINKLGDEAVTKANEACSPECKKKCLNECNKKHDNNKDIVLIPMHGKISYDTYKALSFLKFLLD